MRLINKESVTRVVDECYPSSSYKIFTINSKDGKNKCNSIGLFVSLGITTSMKTLQSVSKYIGKSLDIDSSVSEIESRMIDKEYLNCISRNEVYEQYNSDVNLSNANFKEYNKSDIIELIYKIRDKICESKEISDILKYSNELDRINRVIKRVNSNNWDDYIIQLNDSNNDISISVINKKVNYSMIETINENGDIEVVHKRIGILIKF